MLKNNKKKLKKIRVQSAPTEPAALLLPPTENSLYHTPPLLSGCDLFVLMWPDPFMFQCVVDS